jgi:tetratricopeptide (TPR) repeat protein
LSKNLIEVIEHSIFTKQFVTAHNLALLLPIKDFSTLKDVKDAYIDVKNRGQQVINEGMLLFKNLFEQVENKAAVLINLAYFEEFLNPNNADQSVLKVLEGNPPLEYIIKFYRWLRDKLKKPNYLKRLSTISQKANNDILQKFCKDSDEINLLSHSKERILVINKLESFISEFRTDIDVVEIGKWINSVLNSASQGLESLGDNYSKSLQWEEAIGYYEDAIRGFRIFTEIKPDEPTNFAMVITILGKILDKLERLKINGNERKRVVEQIRTYSEGVMKLIPHLYNERRYDVCRRYGFMFKMLGKLNEDEGKGDTAIACYQKGVDWFNKASENFRPPEDPMAEKTLLQTNAIAKGDCLRGLQRYDEAIKGYETILNKYPDWYEGYLEKGKTLMELGVENYEEAEKLHKKCIELKPIDVPAYDSLSILYEKWGRYQEAITTWIKTKRPQKSDWYFFRLARLFEDSGKNKVAANVFKYIISKRQPDHPEVHYRLAQIYIRSFEWEKAIGVLEKKLKIPDNKPFYDFCQLGDCYKNIGERAKAMEWYKKAESVSPTRLPILTRIAKFYEEDSDFDSAIGFVSKNIEILGDHSNTAANYIWRGDLYRKKEEPDSALKDYLKALELNPSIEKVYQRLDELPYYLKETESQVNQLESFLTSTTLDNHIYKRTALSLLQRYIQIKKPENTEKALQLVDTIFQSGSLEYWTYKATISNRLDNDLAKAIEYRSKLLEMPSLSEGEKLHNLCILIKWKVEIGRTNEAKKFVQQLKRIKSIEYLRELDSIVFWDSKDSYEFIADSFLEIKDYRNLLKYSDLLLEKIDPTDKVYLDRNGISLIGLKRFDDAERVYDLLLSNHPDDAKGYYGKGEIKFKRGEIVEAKAHFKQAYQISKRKNDRKGIFPALNRLVKISAIMYEHEEVIETATELLAMDPDDAVIRTSRGLAYISLGRNEEGLEDFKHIFEKKPSDSIAASKLISSLGFKKGYNPPATIKPLFNLLEPANPVFIFNILNTLTGLSIFTKFSLIEDIFLKYSHNLYIRSSIAHYLMKYTIFHYFFNKDYLKIEIKRTISLFKSFNNDELFKELLTEYWGSEKGAYLEFYADMYEKDFTRIDQMINKLDFKNPDVDKITEVVTEIKNFQIIIKEANIGIGLNNIKIHNKYLQGLLDFIKKTYMEFRFKSRDKGYWDTVKQIVYKIDVNELDLMDVCIHYTLLQIDTLANMPKEDFEKSLSPYHNLKKTLQKLSAQKQSGIELSVSEDVQKEITQAREKTQVFIKTCRFPIFRDMSPLEIGRELEQSFGYLKEVKFSFEGIDDDDSIYADPLRIRSCIENLIFNAHDAIVKKRKNNMDDLIHVKLFIEDDKFGISCTDTGIGMSPEKKDAYEKGITEGLGILYIIKTVNDHNGELFLESREGEGTKIKILLPMEG